MLKQSTTNYNCKNNRNKINMDRNNCIDCKLMMYDEAGRRPIRWHKKCKVPLCTLCAYRVIVQYERDEGVICPYCPYDKDKIDDAVVTALWRFRPKNMCWSHGALLTLKCKNCKIAFCKECCQLIDGQEVMKPDVERCKAGTNHELVQS